MSRFRRPQGLTIWPMLLALVWATGCARPSGPQSDHEAPPVDQHHVPFENGNRRPPDNVPPGDSPRTPDNGLKAETGLPFREPQNLPAGTLLTVRLKNPLSAESPGSNGTFEAVVDQPVVIEGNQLVPLGATVVGRVESAQASNLKPNRGYVRLALDSIHLAGLTLPIQTSSLFVRGNPGETEVPQDEAPQNEEAPTVIRLEKGRRLTFRLTEPMSPPLNGPSLVLNPPPPSFPQKDFPF